MTYAERTRACKKILSAIYGHKNVSVTKYTGTAAHWVEINVRVSTPRDCDCRFTPAAGGRLKGCQACKDRASIVKKEVEEALKCIEFSTWYSDDGMDDKPHKALTIHVNHNC